MIHFAVSAMSVELQAISHHGGGIMHQVNASHVRSIRMAGAGAAILVLAGAGTWGRPAGTTWASEAPPLPAKSLSPEEVHGLQEGEGMGLARVAEVNGYPGPAHVHEAAQAGKIHLYAEQRDAIQRVHAATTAEAKTLGRQILAQEASLEGEFRMGHIVEADLARHVEEIGRNLVELRLIHLRAHVLTAGLLRPEQIEEYYQFRGLTVPSSGHRVGY
jgi:hypothetical protein